jgi:glycosyltransferase involved in cell wall biosynthesis
MNTKLQPPLLGKVGVIGLAPDQWSSRWMDRHFVMDRLAKYFHVAWMYQPSWRECLAGFGSGNGTESLSAPRRDSLHVYRPQYWLPNLGRPAALANFTLRQRLKHVRDMLRSQGCTKLVLYIFRPEFANALDQIPHDFSVYHVNDEYSFTSTEVAVSAKERQILESVNQVILTSPALMEKRGGFNRNTEFVPMGVDYSLYATPAPEPEDLRSIPHPRIGYVGYLKAQLDWPLLFELTRHHPEWSFVFVGPKRPHREMDRWIERMSSLQNVHFLGGKPTDQLGGYAQHFDACIMPYVLDDYTKYVYPLKLHEYLATGLPVISSRMYSVEEFSPVVAIADTPEQWSNLIKHSLLEQENLPEKRAQRQAVARNYDWDTLVQKIARPIADHFDMHLPDVDLADDPQALMASGVQRPTVQAGDVPTR